jgi:hypothetical protein
MNDKGRCRKQRATSTVLPTKNRERIGTGRRNRVCHRYGWFAPAICFVRASVRKLVHLLLTTEVIQETIPGGSFRKRW